MKSFRIFGRNVRDAFKSVFRNFALSLASMSCITITLIIVAVSIILSYNVNNFTTEVENNMTIVVFLEPLIDEEDIPEVEDKIRLLSYIDTIEFNDKMSIKENLMEVNEELKIVLEKYTTREENPLSDTFHVRVTDINRIEEVALQIDEIEKVLAVRYGEGLIEQLISSFDVIRNFSLGAVVALIIVTAFLIANTIKITIFSRKREISIMRLVGASNANIKIPFILEGLFLGVIGAVIPILITTYGYVAIYDRFSSTANNFSPFIRLIIPEPFVYYVSGILLLIGIIVGMFGSYTAVRKHLKI